MTEQQQRMYLFERGWAYHLNVIEERWYYGIEPQTYSFDEAVQRQRAIDARVEREADRQ